VLSLTQDALWSDLRAGTILTIAEDVPDDLTFNPGAGDWWINVQATNGGSGQFISASNFSVSNDDTQISILDATHAVLFGPAGEGVLPLSGINNREVWKLEADPSALITPTTFYNDGSSSSFGSPNRWNGGTNVQSLAALRAALPEPSALTLFGVVALAARKRRSRAQ
jgi:hypothetical protein